MFGRRAEGGAGRRARGRLGDRGVDASPGALVGSAVVTWTKNADEIITHAKPSPHQKKTYNTRH